MGESRLTIVLLTHNRLTELIQTIERLLGLAAQPPIVVVDSASTDGTAAAVRGRFPVPRVQLVRVEENLGAAARNIGVRRAETPYVAFCDDDSIWESAGLGLAADLLDAYPRVGLVTGAVLVGPAGRRDPVSDVMAASPLPGAPGCPGHGVLGFVACAAVVRREPFLAAGGFERRMFVGGEEELLALDLASAGWFLQYLDVPFVHHEPSPRRDRRGRRRIVARNRLWVAWLRRPLPVALSETRRLLRACRSDPDLRWALRAALRELPWVLAQRRTLPSDVERQLRCLAEIA
ncbi:MAG: glycosyltransferase [Chloroflexi bacterium]|nr:glycosyltransferase [Chloroflexota bacterium]